MKESPIFTRVYDLQHWLLGATRKFPREQRFVLARRLNDLAFELENQITAAVYDTRHTADHLVLADVALTSLRKALLHGYEFGHLSAGQYRHVGEIVAEVGRLLGGWRKG